VGQEVIKQLDLEGAPASSSLEMILGPQENKKEISAS
jgi:hypothetical protein